MSNDTWWFNTYMNSMKQFWKEKGKPLTEENFKAMQSFVSLHGDTLKTIVDQNRAPIEGFVERNRKLLKEIADKYGNVIADQMERFGIDLVNTNAATTEKFVNFLKTNGQGIVGAISKSGDEISAT